MTVSPGSIPVFRLLDPSPESERDTQRQAVDARQLPKALGNHEKAAPTFQPGEPLVTAINVALSVGAPLLLTGEPGTGKTQVAFYVAWYFGLLKEHFFPHYVRSSTTAEQVEFEFDTVAYFHAANDKTKENAQLDKDHFLKKRALWNAFISPRPAVVLLDEIDKAPRDFPNDLLNVLDQRTFYVPPLDSWVKQRDDVAPPLVVITSNSERRLPEPFLRRCIFHHIEFTDDLVRKAVKARAESDFPRLDDATKEAALKVFLDLRNLSLRKKPATAELLMWLAALSAMGNVTAETLRLVTHSQLPALGALIKDRDDLALLR